MKFVAYADESGTDGKSPALIVGGLIGLQGEWVSFCRKWQEVLNRHSAKYFHFREWADASSVIRGTRPANSSFEKNPYKTWSQTELDDFLIELAQVAVSENKLVVGGYVPPEQLRTLQEDGGTKVVSSPEELCVSYFFDSIISTIAEERKALKRQKISCFFDHTTDSEWRNVIQNGFDTSCRKHGQFSSFTIVKDGLRRRVKDGDIEFLPLQAADMVAYRMRHLMANLVNLDFTGPTWDKLDNILFGKMNSSMEKQDAKRSIEEKEAILWQYYPGLKGVPYKKAVDLLYSKAKFKNATITKI